MLDAAALLGANMLTGLGNAGPNGVRTETRSEGPNAPEYERRYENAYGWPFKALHTTTETHQSPTRTIVLGYETNTPFIMFDLALALFILAAIAFASESWISAKKPKPQTNNGA